MRHLSIQGNLQDFDTISEERAKEVRNLINANMKKYTAAVGALGRLASFLDDKDPPNLNL